MGYFVIMHFRILILCMLFFVVGGKAYGSNFSSTVGIGATTNYFNQFEDLRERENLKNLRYNLIGDIQYNVTQNIGISLSAATAYGFDRAIASYGLGPSFTLESDRFFSELDVGYGITILEVGTEEVETINFESYYYTFSLGFKKSLTYGLLYYSSFSAGEVEVNETEYKGGIGSLFFFIRKKF